MKRYVNKSGFTLIELMLVVAILGILASIAIPVFMTYQAKSKQTEAQVTLGAILTSEESYFTEHNFYSDDFYAIGFNTMGKPKYYDFTATAPASVTTGGGGVVTSMSTYAGSWIGAHSGPSGWGDGPPTGTQIGLQDSSFLPGIGMSGHTFTALAVGNLDDDVFADVWVITSNHHIVKLQSDDTAR